MVKGMNKPLTLAALAIAVASAGCVEEVGPFQSTSEPRIAFMSRRDGNEEIYTMNTDGNNIHRLTTNNARDTRPAWSADGSKIAFQSERDGNNEIYVMNSD